jgi:2-keto-4-pentenoate hydratase/2-oxohepta-3-ene-1,7-dioic acid hydratase in catechol pathway
VRLANSDGRAAVLVPAGAVDLAKASGGALPADLPEVYARWDDVLAWWAAHQTDEWVPDAVPEPTLLGPPSPRPAQIFAVALNYAPHAAEAGFTPPAEPLIFTKFPTCLTGQDATVTLPPGKVDWEVELVAVIGRETYDVGPDEGWAAVAGLTIGQDLSERVTQLAGKPAQFSLGKSFPGFGPIGPALVTPDELPDPDDLAIACAVNGVPRQSDRTSAMIFGVAELVSRLSRVCRLLPGDLVFTGTPSGVGNRLSPPVYLAPGDVLTSTVEGLGELRTTFAAPSG